MLWNVTPQHIQTREAIHDYDNKLSHEIIIMTIFEYLYIFIFDGRRVQTGSRGGAWLCVHPGLCPEGGSGGPPSENLTFLRYDFLHYFLSSLVSALVGTLSGTSLGLKVGFNSLLLVECEQIVPWDVCIAIFCFPNACFVELTQT